MGVPDARPPERIMVLIGRTAVSMTLLERIDKGIESPKELPKRSGVFSR